MPALIKPASPTLATLEDVDFREDPDRRLAGASELGGIDAAVERLLAEIEIPDLGWTFRISSGVSQGIDKSVVQSDREFLNVGVGGRR